MDKYKKFIVYFIGILFIGNIIFADDFIIDEPSSSDNKSFNSVSATLENKPIPEIGSIPTPDNYKRGNFVSEFGMYDGGGFSIRLTVGIFNIMSIGIIENFDGLIGTGDIHPNIPGAFLKISIFDNPNHFNLALGLDSFAFGQSGSYVSTNGISDMKYGIYLSGGQSYTVFKSKNMFTFGFRFPLLPNDFRNITNSTFYLGATLGTPVIRVGFTLENFFLDFTRIEEVLPSIILTFSPISSFELGIAIQYIIPQSSINRVLTIKYIASF